MRDLHVPPVQVLQGAAGGAWSVRDAAGLAAPPSRQHASPSASHAKPNIAPTTKAITWRTGERGVVEGDNIENESQYHNASRSTRENSVQRQDPPRRHPASVSGQVLRGLLIPVPDAARATNGKEQSPAVAGVRVDTGAHPLIATRPVRLLRQITAVLALAFSTWASVVDNPAICIDETSPSGDEAPVHGTPVGSHCCLTAPCRTPVVSAAPSTIARPSLVPSTPGVAAPHLLSGIDSPAPPTPPPTSFDLA